MESSNVVTGHKTATPGLALPQLCRRAVLPAKATSTSINVARELHTGIPKIHFGRSLGMEIASRRV